MAHMANEQERKSTLRLITCGSADDGKSTLIGRLLHNSKLVSGGRLAALETDPKKACAQGDGLDFALLADGLAAGREQGTAIDVASLSFSTGQRTFIVADAPGHGQYMRNMITGAFTPDLAVIVVDASEGVLTQARRDSYLASLLGIRHVVLAVNKLDLVGYSRDVFDGIEADYRSFAAQIGLGKHVTAVPVSALRGDNITAISPNTPWYDGPTLIGYLETVQVADDTASGALRLPVQRVNQPGPGLRGYSGRIAGGTVTLGQRVRIVPSGQESTVERIVTTDGDPGEAAAGQSVTLTLADETDVSRGDVICDASAPASLSDQFECHLVWTGEDPMLPGRPYLLKLGTQMAGTTVARPKYKVNVNTLEHAAARTLETNEIGVCNLSLDRPVPFDPYTDNRETGGFILVDRLTNNTVAAGLLHFALRRAGNIHWQPVEVDKTARARQKEQRPTLVWLTGLSGAGKSTIANLVDKKLHERGYHTYLLDGDNVRHGLSKDLGFTEADRVENIRRVAEVARLMVDAGLIVLASFISPFRAERQMARDLLEEGEFIEVHVDVPLHVAESRDRKGLYAKARRGELPNFTGIDSPYEPPDAPELHIDAAGALSAEQSADLVVEYLRCAGVIASAGL